MSPCLGFRSWPLIVVTGFIFVTMGCTTEWTCLYIRVKLNCMYKQDDCLICDRIDQIKNGSNPYYVNELETGYVVLGDYQFFRGYTLFLCKYHVPELHCLDPELKIKYLSEMAVVAEAVFKGFQPHKLNYELLGNTHPHLHWHLFPRYLDDPSPGTTSWKVDKAIRYANTAKPSEQELRELKGILLQELQRTLKTEMPEEGE